MRKADLSNPCPQLNSHDCPDWIPTHASNTAGSTFGMSNGTTQDPAVGRAVEDANVEVRRAAAEALGALGGDEAVRLLVRLRKDANPYVRAAAEEAIGKTSGVRFS